MLWNSEQEYIFSVATGNVLNSDCVNFLGLVGLKGLSNSIEQESVYTFM